MLRYSMETRSSYHLVMFVSSTTSVANNLEPANHLANGEESNQLGEDDAVRRKLRLAEVSDLVEVLLWGSETR